MNSQSCLLNSYLYNVPKSNFCLVKNNDCVSFAGKTKTGTGYYSRHRESNYAGCILGFAIGDAFGAPVEFMKDKKILKKYGEKGLEEFVPNDSGLYSFTDDTELTIYTADGLLKSSTRKFGYNTEPLYHILFDSYKGWYDKCALGMDVKNKGWLLELKQLGGTCGSGKTCMNVLSKNVMGSTSQPINDSKGSGGIMRAAPIGLMYYKNPQIAFNIGCESAALTHGNPTGYLSAGVYSAIIAYIINGYDLEDAIEKSMKFVDNKQGSAELKECVNKAIELSKTDIEPKMAIKQIGKGWFAHEALGIAIYCALKTPNDYKAAIINAVNHDGDSDTVGAITGGLLGTYLGDGSIPESYKQKIHLKDELISVAHDLYVNPKHLRHSQHKYPTDFARVYGLYTYKKKDADNHDKNK